MVVVFDANSLEFSKEPGVYDSDVDLKIQAGIWGSVYYTLDGSEPTPENGIKYNGKAIKLTDASELPNRNSDRNDTSAAFCDEKTVVKYGNEPKEFEVPNYNVDKGYYVKARYYNPFGIAIRENEGMYFVNLDERGYYDNLAILSITTDEDNLWGYERGINCTGKAYDEFKKKLDAGEVDDFRWASWKANYNSFEGMDGERPCRVQFYDENHQLSMDTQCGLRLQGHWSVAENQKSFSIFCRKEYSGEETFPVDLNQSGHKQRKYIINMGGDDNVYKLDYYLFGDKTCEGLNFSETNFRGTMVFLNGEFWGFYWIYEPYNENYVAGTYGVNADDVIIYKNKVVEVGTEEDEELWNTTYDFITKEDMSDAKNYEKACQLIDMSSFVDYYAFMHFLARKGDWPQANEACRRVRTPSEELGYNDGRWRWMVFDLNSPEAICDMPEVYVYDKPMNDPKWLSFMQNEDFRAYYAARLQVIANYVLNPAKIDKRIDEYLAKYMEPIKASDKRFFGDDKEEAILYNASEKKYFIRRRHDISRYMVGFFCGGQYLIPIDE